MASCLHYLTINFLNNITESPQLSNAGMMHTVILLSVSSVTERLELISNPNFDC